MSVGLFPGQAAAPGGVTPPPPGSMANYTYTASTLATMPLVTSLADGTLVWVQSQRSWYRSDLAGNTYRREPIADVTWLSQNAWGIDTVAGNDENIGSVASPLKTFAEYKARKPEMGANDTVTIAAGSTFTNADPMEYEPVLNQSTGALAILTIAGTRVLGANVAIVTATAEAANQSPTLDIGAALTLGAHYQVTSGARNGATTVALELIAGTNYRVAPWRSSGGAISAAPAAADTIAKVTLTTVARFGIASPNIIVLVSDLDLTAVDTTICINNYFATCKIGGSMSLLKPMLMQWDGCSLFQNSFVSLGHAGCRVLASLCGFVRNGGGVVTPAITVTAGGFIQFTNCVATFGGVGTIGLDVQTLGQVNANHLGIFGTTTTAVDVHVGGFLNVTNTLYGGGAGGLNTGKGTRVREGGACHVLTGFVPTLASTNQELELENAATANTPPPLATGVIPPAIAMINWAAWNAAGRYLLSYSTAAKVVDQTP